MLDSGTERCCSRGRGGVSVNHSLFEIVLIILFESAGDEIAECLFFFVESC